MPVYLYGQPAAMDALGELARARGLVIVADAAQAVGASYAGRPVAAWADAATLSFYPTKNLGACGDGGMVLTTRDDVAERVRAAPRPRRRRAGTRTSSWAAAAGSTSCRRRCCA